MNSKNRSWICVLLALAAAVVFTVGAIEAPSQSLKDAQFDILLGLMLVSVALAVSWAPPAE